jgi:CubicO group peptidase (beta-lactamase class C family)
MKTRWQNVETCLNAEFEKALSKGVFPGASLLVAVERTPVIARTWGYTQSTGGAPVTLATRFDLASLTKPLVTAPLCMVARARGGLDLDDSLHRFFPRISIPSEKHEITIRHLLSHASGFPAHRPFFTELVKLTPEVRKEALLAMILETPLQYAPGKEAIYSDLGFLLLGIILENTFGESLDRLAEKILFEPLGIKELSFRPFHAGKVPEDIPEQGAFPAGEVSFAAGQVCPWRKRLLVGEVDDENAWSLGGVAGHAGLFGTANGVFSLLGAFWGIYERGGDLLPRDLVRLFWTRTAFPENSTWALGYDSPSKINSSAGRYFSPNSIGHLGFTGGSFWLDLERHVLAILLTNRIHPTRQNEGIRQFRPLVHDIIMEAIDYGK